MRLRIALCALACSAACAAADVSGPVAGYVWDGAARAVRPVVGMPGASLLGEPLDFGLPLSYAAVAPNQDFILAAASDGTLRLLRPGSNAAAAIETPHGVPARIVFSPSGSAALLINADTADVYTGLPGNPTPARTLSLAAIAPVVDWAVSDDGLAALAASAQAVWAAGESAEWSQVARVPAARAAFAAGSREAAVASRAGISLHRDPVRGGEVIALSAADDALEPSAAAFLRDGRILVADSAARSIVMLDAAGARRTVACDCSPAGLSAWGGLFRLNEMSDGPLWLLDPAGDSPRLVFVPALPKPPETP